MSEVTGLGEAFSGGLSAAGPLLQLDPNTPVTLPVGMLRQMLDERRQLGELDATRKYGIEAKTEAERRAKLVDALFESLGAEGENPFNTDAFDLLGRVRGKLAEANEATEVLDHFREQLRAELGGEAAGLSLSRMMAKVRQLATQAKTGYPLSAEGLQEVLGLEYPLAGTGDAHNVLATLRQLINGAKTKALSPGIIAGRLEELQKHAPWVDPDEARG